MENEYQKHIVVRTHSREREAIAMIYISPLFPHLETPTFNRKMMEVMISIILSINYTYEK